MVKKLSTEKIAPKVIFSGIGSISENDISLAQGDEKAVVLGFNVKTDPRARSMAEKIGVEIKTFDIIYKLTEWMEDILCQKTPKIQVEEVTALAKVLKTFSKIKSACKVSQNSVKIHGK